MDSISIFSNSTLQLLRYGILTRYKFHARVRWRNSSFVPSFTYRHFLYINYVGYLSRDNAPTAFLLSRVRLDSDGGQGSKGQGDSGKEDNRVLHSRNVLSICISSLVYRLTSGLLAS